MSNYSNISSIGLEHPSVKKVIEIAEAIVYENKVLNIDALYYRAKRTLKIPRKGLNTIIQFLINKKILVNRSKYIKKTVLTSDLRQKIYNFIYNNIGTHFSLLKKHFSSEDKSQSPGELIWHLDMLLKFNYIKKLNFQKYTIFLPSEIDDESGVVYFLIKDSLNKKIINLLISNGSLKRNEIYKLLQEKRENVYYHLNVLIENKIINLNENNEIIIKSNLKKKILKMFSNKKEIPKISYKAN